MVLPLLVLFNSCYDKINEKDNSQRLPPRLSHFKLKAAIDGSKYGRFSRKWLNFNPCMASLVVLNWIHRLQNSLSIFFIQSLTADIAASRDRCILIAGKPAVRILWLHRGDSSVSTECVHGGIEQFSFLQLVVEGKKIH